MAKMKIAPNLSLPLDAVTSTIVVYGGKGMGKTNLASVLVEEFAVTGLRFAVIDPMGVWWGLRHSADGKGPGIKALILGGIHGDMPIEPTAGAVVADLVVDENESVIIDISRRADGSMWSIAERVRFVTAYAKRLYQRQGEKRRPVMQVIDEAARFAPQIVRHGESEVAACMGAIAVIVEEGRNVGIGVTLVTQRSARLNKDVAELADCVFAFRIAGPNSMRAVLDWLGEHVEKASLKDFGEKLRSLPRGTALVVSPGWLEFEGIAEIRKRRTFDSSKTPEAGKEVRASGAGAKVDLAKYQERMAEVVERAKENDPKALKARVVELQRQLAAKPGKPGKVRERSVLKPADLKRIEAALARVEKVASRLETVGGEAAGASADLVTLGEVLQGAIRQATWDAAPVTPPAVISNLVRKVVAASLPHPSSRRSAPTHANGANGAAHANGSNGSRPEGITPAKQRILDGLALLSSVRRQPAAPKKQVALFSNASPKGGAFGNNLGALRTAGLIDYPIPGTVALTDAGARLADRTRAPQTAAEMHELIRGMVSPAKWRIIDALITAYPTAVSKAELAEMAGASPGGGAFGNNLGSLRSLGVLDYPTGGMVRAEPVLFLE